MTSTSYRKEIWDGHAVCRIKPCVPLSVFLEDLSAFVMSKNGTSGFHYRIELVDGDMNELVEMLEVITRYGQTSCDSEEKTMPTVKLKAKYSLTLKAYKKLIEEGQNICREQEIEFEVDAAQAIVAGAAWIDFRGMIHPSKNKERELLSQKARCNIAGILWSMDNNDPPMSKSLWCITDDISHVLTPEEARNRYLATLVAQEQERGRTETKKIRTLLDEWIPRILAGEGAISETQYSFEIRLDTVMILSKDVLENLLTDQEKERLREVIFLEDKGEKHVRTKWIAEHGSDALKKKLESDFDQAASKLYHSERIVREIGEDWFFVDVLAYYGIVDLTDPSKIESKALSEALARWPDRMLDVRLVHVRANEIGKEEEEWDGSVNGWPSALIMRLPWELTEKAIHFI